MDGAGVQTFLGDGVGGARNFFYCIFGRFTEPPQGEGGAQWGKSKITVYFKTLENWILLLIYRTIKRKFWVIK